MPAKPVAPARQRAYHFLGCQSRPASMTGAFVDPYAVLGVPRDATPAAIRRAYRAKARRAHPDGGGSAEYFEQVKAAYDTLIDDARRRRYDETGEPGEGPADHRRAELIETLFTALDTALLRLSQRARLPEHANLVLLTAEVLRLQRQEWTGRRREFERVAEQSRHLLGRFITASRNNLMETVVERRVQKCRTEIEALDQRIRTADEALKVLKEMTFRADDDTIERQWASIAELVRRYG
jgi:curved DNA-binding protein CbpA